MVKAPINTIYLFESLNASEKATGTELYEDTIKRYADFYEQRRGNRLDVQIFKIADKSQFLECLTYVEINAPYIRPGLLLHIETHGLANKSGLSLDDESEIYWDELKPHLISINVALENQLYISMATCYGRYLHEAIDISQQAPFAGYISASTTILTNEILEDYTPFYSELIATRDILEAFKILDQRQSNFYYKDVETVFNDILLNWLKNMKMDPSFRQDFIDQCKRDYELVKESGFPDVENLPIDKILDIVKLEFITKFRKHFLFKKGRD